MMVSPPPTGYITGPPFPDEGLRYIMWSDGATISYTPHIRWNLGIRD